jgi:hypothetical protein
LFFLHTFASSPPEAGLPGWAYHAGTDINPAATWWPMARGLMDYLARCSYMLRQGWFVADVCYYYGDQAPNFFRPCAMCRRSRCWTASIRATIMMSVRRR